MGLGAAPSHPISAPDSWPLLSLPGLTRQSMRSSSTRRLALSPSPGRPIMDARVRPGHDTECGAPSEWSRFEFQTAKRHRPYFLRRQVRRPSLSSPSNVRGWSAKRRTSLPSCRALASENAGASRRSIAAISVPGAVASGRGPRRLLAHPIRRAFARLRPRRVQPTEGQPHVVGADGCPGPPGRMRARHPRGRRISSRPHDAS